MGTWKEKINFILSCTHVLISMASLFTIFTPKPVRDTLNGFFTVFLELGQDWGFVSIKKFIETIKLTVTQVIKQISTYISLSNF